MQILLQRAAAWNAARYDRIFDLELTKKLLHEEYLEVLEAGSLPDKVHELCDICFVAAGALWKLDYSESDLPLVNGCALHLDDLLNILSFSPVYMITALIDAMTHETAKGTLIIISMLAAAELFCLGLIEEEIDACMLALCDSNDSKSIKKTAPDVKANSGDKGPYYFSPKAKIIEIVEKVNERTRNTN